MVVKSAGARMRTCGDSPEERTCMNEFIEALAAHPFFRGMDPRFLDLLAPGAYGMEFKPGETLFREGEPASRFFLVQRGRIVLEAHEPGDGTMVVSQVGPGDVLGWSWLFPPFAWHFRARALEPTRVIILDGAHLLVTAERNPEFGYDLMKRIAQVVIQRLQATRRELLRTPALTG